MEELIKDLQGNAKASIMKDELKNAYPFYEELKSVLEMDKIQMRMPYHFELY